MVSHPRREHTHSEH